MSKSFTTKFIILMVILLIVAKIISIYDPFTHNTGWPSSLSNYPATGLYKIDPETILASLDKGNIDVFLPDARSVDERDYGPAVFNLPVLWSQTDNLRIVRALNNFVWKDNIDEWSLLMMSFGVDCEDNLNGLPGGIFMYFKTIHDKGKIADSWREIHINVENASVAWSGDAKFAHPLLGRKSIDLNGLKVTAEEAIRIAEENGGREARLSVRNRCGIYLLLMPERFRGWIVDYQSADFEIKIDPYTGEVIK